jgi:hypothetical protein
MASKCPSIRKQANVRTGSPELGRVRTSELESHKGPFGIGIELDLHFEADKTLSAYGEAARTSVRIEAQDGGHYGLRRPMLDESAPISSNKNVQQCVQQQENFSATPEF